LFAVFSIIVTISPRYDGEDIWLLSSLFSFFTSRVWIYITFGSIFIFGGIIDCIVFVIGNVINVVKQRWASSVCCLIVDIVCLIAQIVCAYFFISLLIEIYV